MNKEKQAGSTSSGQRSQQELVRCARPEKLWLTAKHKYSEACNPPPLVQSRKKEWCRRLLGLVGEYAGDVGLYAGLVGEYLGDVGLYAGLVGE